MLCYGVLCGRESFVSNSVQHVLAFTSTHSGCLCKIFDSTEEAVHFIEAALQPTLTKLDLPRPVPTKSRTVAYLGFSFLKEINKCDIVLKKRTHKGIITLPPIEIKCSDNIRVITELRAISVLVDATDDDFTVYTTCQDLLKLYNKCLPEWEKNEWTTKSPTPEYNELRLLREKIGNRCILLKETQKDDPLVTTN